jgi:hypothetical protein
MHLCIDTVLDLRYQLVEGDLVIAVLVFALVMSVMMNIMSRKKCAVCEVAVRSKAMNDGKAVRFALQE